MRSKLVFLTVGLSMLLTGNRSMAGVITLYDGADGLTPDQYLPTSLSFTNVNTIGNNGKPRGIQGSNGDYTALDTRADNGIYAGYSNYNLTTKSLVNLSFPSLDRAAGYTVSFNVKTTDITNSNTAVRAGFSVIALSSDKLGIEIGFNPTASATNSYIFSQDSPSFNAIGEKTKTTDATLVSNLLSNFTPYDLNISGNNYTLTSGGTPILAGSLRNYSAAGNVYDTPNFLFFGDDTTSAQALTDFGSITLSTNTAGVPYEFSPTAGILALVAMGTINHLLKKKKS